MKKLTLFLLSAFCLLFSACAPTQPATLTVMTHDSFAISEAVVKSFEDANNVKVSFLQSGDAGSVLNQAILTKDAPLADVLFGVDNTFLSRALDADIFEAYQSPALSDVPAEFVLDSTYRALPVDYSDVCINYDKNYFAENNLTVPQSFEDLAKPEYNGLLVTEDPATSSSGLAFMPRLLAEPERQRRGGRGWLGDGLLHQLLRLFWQRPAADGGLLRLQPRRGSVLRRRAIDRIPDRFHRCFRHVLPPD